MAARNSVGKSSIPSMENDFAPIFLPALKPSERSRLSYAARLIPFTGREREFNLLEGFLKDDRHFSWIAVAGLAGSGKSRLLLEFCHSVNSNWTTGFIDRHAKDFSWLHWRPLKPTLLVIDYASTQLPLVRKVVATLSRSASLSYPVRLVLLDRIVDQAWERRLFGGGSELQQAMESRSPIITLAPLSNRETTALLKQITQTTEMNESDILFGDEFNCGSQLPLFVAMTTFAIADGKMPRQWGPDVLIRDWLCREKEEYWLPKGVTESEIRLLCLACIAGDITVESALEREALES